MVRSLTLRYRRILITRVQDQAGELTALLRTHNATIHHIPVLEIIPLKKVAHTCVAQIPDCERVIFISVNAVQCGLSLVPELDAHLRSNVRSYAIGDATAARLGVHGIKPEVSGEANSESLLRLPSMGRLDGSRVLLVRGLGGRTLLAKTLSQRGATVVHLPTYRRVLPKRNTASLQKLIQARAYDVAVVASVSALRNAHRMADALSATFCSLPICVPGKRIAAAARRLGHTRILESRSIDVADVFAALC